MNIDPETASAISQLSDADKRDLNQAVGAEVQKAKIQETVHTLTEICWAKCVTGKIASAKLEKGEEGCAKNCVERFLDANGVVLRQLEVMRGEGL